MFVSVNITPKLLLSPQNQWIIHLTGRMDGYVGEIYIPYNPQQENYTLMLMKPVEKDRATPKQRRRASMKQEESVARLHGGHRNLGSGSVPGRKSDASIREKYRIENKFTSGKGIRVTRADLQKIRSECERGQIPVYQIDFKAPTTLKTEEQWVMVPLDEWEKRIAATDDHS